jgi:tetraacyldisaccharide 4'-kinase
VAVAPNRLEAARALLAANPQVNIVVADDGLQHWPLPRDVEVLVFDARGVGNGLAMPAGPLREPMPACIGPNQLVLYNAAQPSTPLPGAVAVRGLGGAVLLADWWAGVASSHDQLQALAITSQTKPVLAAAGMADPEKFFGMLEAAGFRIVRLPQPDHASFTPPPWPASTADVLVTEKDAVKLQAEAMGGVRVWVVTLDFQLPTAFTQALDQMLPQPACLAP